MLKKKFRCERCDGAIEISSRFTHSVTCRYCNTAYVLENNTIKNSGIVQPFEPLSIFKIGLNTTYKSKNLEIKGRIRLADEDDFWDEWFVLLDNKPFWIEESYDTTILFNRMNITSPLPQFLDISVGSSINVENINMYITEKGSAIVQGIEGEFAGKIKLKDNYKYAQATTKGKQYAIEYYNDAIHLLEGEILKKEEVIIATS